MININNKRWDKITARDIQKVLSGTDDESFFFEFKSDDEEPNKLVKEISALANTYDIFSLESTTIRVLVDVRNGQSNVFILRYMTPLHQHQTLTYEDLKLRGKRYL